MNYSAMPVSPSVQVEITGLTDSPVAGEMYSLTCTVTISPDLTGTPTVGWTGDEGVMSVTEGTPETSGRVTTLTLTFNPLQDSQDGEYTCITTLVSGIYTLTVMKTSTLEVMGR